MHFSLRVLISLIFLSFLFTSRNYLDISRTAILRDTLDHNTRSDVDLKGWEISFLGTQRGLDNNPEGFRRLVRLGSIRSASHCRCFFSRKSLQHLIRS